MTKCKHCGKEIVRYMEVAWIHKKSQYASCSTTEAEPSEEEEER